MTDTELNSERKKLLRSLSIPLIFLGVCWTIFGYERFFEIDFHFLALFPRRAAALTGIIFSPFLHGSLQHLFSNTFPFLILTSGLFYFYPKSAFASFFQIWFLTGLGVWLFARESYHIGASGLIYGFASYLFFSGIMNKNRMSSVVSLLVVFLYGSMIWGILPGKPEVSWESHLAGFIAGIMSSLWFARKNQIEISAIKEKSLIEEEYQTSDSTHKEYEMRFHYKKEDE